MQKRHIFLIVVALLGSSLPDASTAQGSVETKAMLCKKYQGRNFGVRNGQIFYVDCLSIERAIDLHPKSESSFAASRRDLDRRAGMDLRSATARNLWGSDDCPSQYRRASNGLVYWECQFSIDGNRLKARLIGDTSARLERMDLEMDMSRQIRKSADLYGPNFIPNEAALDFIMESEMLKNRLVASPRETYTRRGYTLYVTITAH